MNIGQHLISVCLRENKKKDTSSAYDGDWQGKKKPSDDLNQQEKKTQKQLAVNRQIECESIGNSSHRELPEH